MATLHAQAERLSKWQPELHSASCLPLTSLYCRCTLLRCLPAAPSLPPDCGLSLQVVYHSIKNRTGGQGGPRIVEVGHLHSSRGADRQGLLERCALCTCRQAGGGQWGASQLTWFTPGVSLRSLCSWDPEIVPLADIAGARSRAAPLESEARSEDPSPRPRWFPIVRLLLQWRKIAALDLL